MKRVHFTGAIGSRSSAASCWPIKGTLFLDEVGDIPPPLQPKLLRILQEQEFERLGSSRIHQVDVRLIAATHRDLPDMVRNGQFRSDLYFRLNVFPVLMPPLRDRREDIPALVAHFVESLGRRVGRPIDFVPPETMAALSSYDWPGNIRELQNLIERAVILSIDGVLPNPLLTAGTKASAFPRLQRLPHRLRTRPDSAHARIGRLGDRRKGRSSCQAWLEAHHADLQDAAAWDLPAASRGQF